MLCCMQDALKRKGKNDKSKDAKDKIDENYEKDAVRLLDKTIKRDPLKKVYLR